MNGRTCGKDGYIIIDRDDVNVALINIYDTADHFIAYPNETAAVVAALCFIREAVTELRDATYEMIGDTRLRIKKAEMAAEKEAGR